MATTHVNRVELAPSGWNYWRPFYASRAWQASFLGVPVLIVGVLFGSQWLAVFGFVLIGGAVLTAIRSQRDAYGTPALIHYRPGLLGLRAAEIPIDQLDEVLIDPVPFLPGMGTLTLKCGSRYLTFECVPDAEQKATVLLRLRDAARTMRQNGVAHAHVAAL